MFFTYKLDRILDTGSDTRFDSNLVIIFVIYILVIYILVIYILVKYILVIILVIYILVIILVRFGTINSLVIDSFL